MTLQNECEFQDFPYQLPLLAQLAMKPKRQITVFLLPSLRVSLDSWPRIDIRRPGMMHRPWLLELEKKETDFQVVPQSSLHEVQEPLVQVTVWASLAFASSWFSHEFLSHMFHWSLVHGFLSQCCLMLSLFPQMLIHTSRHTPFQEQPNPTSPVPPALAPVSEPVYSTVPISPSFHPVCFRTSKSLMIVFFWAHIAS